MIKIQYQYTLIYTLYYLELWNFEHLPPSDVIDHVQLSSDTLYNQTCYIDFWFDDTSDFLHRSVSWSLIHVLAILIHNVDTFYLTLRFGKNGICITILIRFSYSFLYQLSLPAYLSGLIFLTYYFFYFYLFIIHILFICLLAIHLIINVVIFSVLCLFYFIYMIIY